MRVGLQRAIALAGASLALLAASVSDAGAKPKPMRPNFIIVQVDDQAMNTFNRSLMPDTFSWMVDRGTRFTNGLAAPPLCCPDRAGVLTGQYPHNNGVVSNEPGYPLLQQKGNTLPVWMRRAGYRTAMIGKFLNGYDDVYGAKPAPGFDSWFAVTSPDEYYGYGVSDQGRRRTFGYQRKVYSTDLFSRKARAYVDEQKKGKHPYFLWLAYNAPHGAHLPTIGCSDTDPTPPSQSFFHRYANLPLPQPPSYNEADVSDKPPDVAGLPQFGSGTGLQLERRYRCTAAAVGELDRGLNSVMDELKRTGELSNTIVVYLSDNGLYFGEHRITRGKSLPYEPALQVPFAIRVPEAYGRGAAGAKRNKVVSNTDLAPTLLDYAGGVRPCDHLGHCRKLDGRSLRPLLGGPGSFPAGRGVLVEINSSSGDYSAIRTQSRLYAEYAGGADELYDLKDDPDELQSLDQAPLWDAEEAVLAHRLENLAICSGTHGAHPCE